MELWGWNYICIYLLCSIKYYWYLTTRERKFNFLVNRKKAEIKVGESNEPFNIQINQKLLPIQRVEKFYPFFLLKIIFFISVCGNKDINLSLLPVKHPFGYFSVGRKCSLVKINIQLLLRIFSFFLWWKKLFAEEIRSGICCVKLFFL